MEKIEIIFKVLRNLVWTFIVNGVLTIIIGFLIFFYPDLLGMLVGLLLISLGVVFLIGAVKIRKYSKFQIKI